MNGIMPDCIEHAQPTARRQHTCCECDGVIAFGEPYHRISGVWDGEPARFKVCVDCESLRADVDAHSRPDECTAFGYLNEVAYDSGVDEIRERFDAIRAKRRAVV